MATGPTAREVNLDLAGFKSSVEKQFGAVSLLLYWLLGIGVAILGIGFTLLTQIWANHTETATLGERIAALSKDVNRVEKHLEDSDKNSASIADLARQTLAFQGTMNSTLSRIEDKLNSKSQALNLSDDDERIIRNFFGLDKGPPKYKPKYAIGDVVFDTKAVPDDLVAKLPKLRGLTMSFDPGNGSVLFVGTGNRIVGVVEPA
jgi:hypothetical protein